MSGLSHCSFGQLTILWAGIGVAGMVCALLVYSTLSFRQTPGSGAATFAHRTFVEALWATIPVLILIITAMPAVNKSIAAETVCRSADKS